MTPELQNGMSVVIAGKAGQCIGRIEDIRPVDEMPAIDGFPQSGEFAPLAILKELEVERVALISYWQNPKEQVCFTALEIKGEWYDLGREKIELEECWIPV